MKLAWWREAAAMETSMMRCPFDLPTKDGFDRAIFLPNTSSSKKLAAQNIVVLLLTRWKYKIILAMMITPWMFNCWSGNDLAQL